MQRLTFKSFDGKDISYVLWEDVKSPKAIVQIVHGMAEYIDRYDDFAKFLNSKGYVVIGDDHRGHGQTEGEKNLGVATKTCFDDTIKDLEMVSDIALAKYKLPLFVIGHSYGSFLTQRYIQLYSEKIEGAILSGSAWMGSGLVKMGKLIANIQGALIDHNKPAKLIAKMSFGAFSNPFTDTDMENRWLSRDPALVKKYNEDKYCGYVMSVGFQVSFMRSVTKLYVKEGLDSIRKDLPLMLASGALDPVGGAGKLVTKLYEVYQSIGMKDISIKLYEDARHEILNETNKQEVYSDFLAFLDKNLK
jgi:alpha-beta hydrolase superfamily lysophospholipase